MAEDWLPPDYEVPESVGNYMRFEDGANKFRVLSAPILGYVYWNDKGKPVRMKEAPPETPSDIRLDKHGKAEKVKHFWACVVWHYMKDKKGKDTSAIQILELTQVTIQGQVQDLAKNPDWGSPLTYDITVNKKGDGLDTEYTVQPSPHKETPAVAVDAYRKSNINLDALYEGGDPFAED